MKAYCINLDRRPDRRDHMWSRFKELGIDVERVPAVDGSIPEMVDKTESLRPGLSGLRLGAGAYACFQSHRICWQKLVESGDPYAMILEDDLIIADGFSDFLSDEWLPIDADVVRLETFNVRVHLDWRRLWFSRGRYLARLRSTHYGAACYVLSRATANRLYRLTTSISDAVDEVLFDVHHEVSSTLAIYQMVPAPAIQGDRLASGKAGLEWSKTSIVLRFGEGEAVRPEREKFAKRIGRRIKEELRGLRDGTRYTFVRHK